MVKLSGKLFPFPPDKVLLEPFLEYFPQLLARGIQAVLVAGGGATSRFYISTARRFGADESTLDDFGIAVSRLNAALLIVGLHDAAYPHVPTTLDEVTTALRSGRVVVMGGLHPGHSTNATAALVAERVRAELFVNATDVDGVYSADPRDDPKARLLRSVTPKHLTRLLTGEVMGAGTYELLDLVALKIIERSRIPTQIVQCTAEKIDAAVRGRAVGTKIAVGT